MFKLTQDSKDKSQAVFRTVTNVSPVYVHTPLLSIIFSGKLKHRFLCNVTVTRSDTIGVLPSNVADLPGWWPLAPHSAHIWNLYRDMRSCFFSVKYFL